MELPSLVSPPLNRFEDLLWPTVADLSCRLELIAGPHDAMVVMARHSDGEK
jgi:hypothetical protein